MGGEQVAPVACYCHEVAAIQLYSQPLVVDPTNGRHGFPFIPKARRPEALACLDHPT